MFKQGIGWGRGEENGHVCRGRLGSGMFGIDIPLYLMDRIVGLGLLDSKSRCIANLYFPPTFQTFLDGLTIGSDHTFDMSLCFGHGSGGGGEGGWSWLKEFLD
jgi:hypothetical protein